MLLGAVLVAAPMALPAGATFDLNDYAVVYNGSTQNGDAGTTTFNYELTGPEGESVSHLIGGSFCTTPSSFDPEYNEDKTQSADPTTGAFGYKWGDNIAVGTTFAITFDGLYADTGSSEWTIKKGSEGPWPTFDLAGPDCGTPPVEPTCPDEGDVWNDANQNQVIDDGECTTPTVPTCPDEGDVWNEREPESGD